MAKHAPLPLCSSHRAYNAYYLIRYNGIAYYIHQYTTAVHTCAHYGTDGTTCSTFDIPYSSSVQYARNIMGLFFYKAHARGAQVLCYPYVPGTMAFGVSEWMLLVPQAVARWTVRGQ